MSKIKCFSFFTQLQENGFSTIYMLATRNKTTKNTYHSAMTTIYYVVEGNLKCLKRVTINKTNKI